jgi:ABC-2 type transport system permease protein
MMQGINKSHWLTIVLIALVMIFAIHTIARNTETLRIDLTADDLYSLSDGTLQLLGKMNHEGVRKLDLSLYFSATNGKTLPSFIKDFVTYERYLRALLVEYELAAAGKIEINFIDPLTDSDEAQDATDFGLDGKAINQHGDLFFFGLVLETQTGSRDVIDFLWPTKQETIEYEITKMINNLIWPTHKRIGVLTSLELLADSNPYMAQILAAQGKQPVRSWISMRLLEESYSLSLIAPETETISPDDFDLVLVVHPKALAEQTLRALDTWIVNGGNALIFLDPFAIDDQAPQDPQQPWLAQMYKPSSNLSPLLEAWGLKRKEDLIAADFDLAVKRPASPRGPAERLLVDLLFDDRMAPETLDGQHPILQGLTDLRFFLAGGLETTEVPEGVSVTPLISTTARGNTIRIEPGFPEEDKLVFMDLSTPAKLQDRFIPGTTPVVLASLVQGQLPSAFPDGDEHPGEASVLVFADVDFISDQIAFQNSFLGTIATNDNHKVLLNAVDYLMGSTELMNVRSKQSIERPFTLFDAIERESDLRTVERERDLRGEIERIQQELYAKQQDSGNQALFQKQVQDDVDRLNERVKQANSELRDIRKEKRAALESEIAMVRFTTLWLMPSLVFVLGVVLLYRRKRSDSHARSAS